jgi:hypothetical protein
MSADTPVTIQATQTLKKACALLLARVADLEKRVQDGDETAWKPYLESLTVLSSVVPRLEPGASGELLKTRDMALRLGIAPKTLLKWRKKIGKVQGAEAVQNGSRGRAAIRWKA